MIVSGSHSPNGLPALNWRLGVLAMHNPEGFTIADFTGRPSQCGDVLVVLTDACSTSVVANCGLPRL